MSPGISEEAGQTTRSLIDAMKAQPALLAMVIANIMMLVFIYYAQHSNNVAWDQVNTYRVEVGKELIDYTKHTSELLARCSVIPNPPAAPR